VPTYAYACTTCDNRFEVQQSFSDAALTECPQCQGRLRKLFNSVGIVFKGSGFYRNDSRNGTAAAAPAAKGETSSGGEGSSGGKSESTAASASSDSSGSSSASGSSGSSGSSAVKSTPAAASGSAA
jgi:putative FmdB family regulatory protein